MIKTLRLLLFFNATFMAPLDLKGDDIVLSPVLLKAMAEVDIPALQDGSIHQIVVREGDKVDENQLLVQLDDRNAVLTKKQSQIQYDIAKLKASDNSPVEHAKVALEVANASLLRALESRKRFADTPSQAELDQIRLKVSEAQQHLVQAEQNYQLAGLTASLAQSAFELAKSDLESFHTKSPIQGTIVEIIARRGEWVRIGSPIARVVQLDRLRAEVYVSKEQSSKLTLDNPVPVVIEMTLESDSIPRKLAETTAKVVFISPEVDANDGRLRIVAELENSQSLMSPGMRVTVRIPMNSKK